MRLREATRLARASIRSHKLRSVLAAAGVVLGIASVVGVVTMGEGFQQSLLGRFTEEFEADLMIIALQRPENVEGPPEAPNINAFTDRDLRAIEDLPHARLVGAFAPLPGAEIMQDGAPVGGLAVNTQYGPSFFRLDEGRDIEGPTEAVISNLTAQRLRKTLNTTNILGVTLELHYVSPAGERAQANITIVGIERPSSFIQEETVSVTADYAPRAYVQGEATHVWRNVLLRASHPSDLDELEREASGYLENASDARSRKGDHLQFRFETQESVSTIIGDAIGQFTAFIGGIGAVSLLVGIVGIANIMLVIVQERTREIGVMKATGATSWDVLLIFLVEAVAICLVGALIGVVGGMGMGWALGQLIGEIATPKTDVRFVFVAEWYAIAAALGVLVGLIAGLYPAWRAARVSPAEALRYE